jgi:CHAT domain-containing protein
MSNFDLKIIPSLAFAAVIADSEFGEASTKISSDRISEMIAESGRLRSLYERSAHSDPDLPLEGDLERFGEQLFEGIFTGEILDLFNRTIGGSKSGNLNIRLMLGRPELNSIQWEIMRFRGEYVGFRHNLFRHPFVLRPVRIPEDPGKTLHVLQVAVDPLYGPVTVAEEAKLFMELMSGFREQIRLTSLFQEQATIDNIIEVLFSGVDIWHFTGHGYFDPTNPLESSLIVWPSKGQEGPGKLSVRALKTLATSQNLGFCFLNACNTGRTEEIQNSQEAGTTGEYFVNMAHSLIEAGIPMVIATNHEITVQAATRLSHRFYTSVIKYGRRVDQAVSEARAELYLRGPGILVSDWSCPILYTRSRYNELGTERLHWQASDIYSLRNVERSVYVQARDPQDTFR